MIAKILNLLIIGLCIIFIANTQGCNMLNNYQQVTTTRAGVTLSFEYPVSYEDTGNTLNRTYDNISLLHFTDDSIIAEADRQFSIVLFENFNNLPFSNAQGYTDDIINGFTEYYKDNFELLEHTTTRIADIEGELIVYIIRGGAMMQPLVNYPNITKAIIFDYKNIVWEVSIDYYIESAEKAEEEFEHIINSFKFLN